MEQLAALRLVVPAALQAIAHDVQFHLAHDPLEAQQEPVVGVVGVVHAVLVGDEAVEDGAHLEEVMPVLGRTGQPAHLQAEHHADVVQRHLGDQPLEAAAPFGRATALAQVLVDDQDALARPAEGHRLVGEGVLPRGRLAVLQDLLWGRLPHVDDRQLFQVGGQDLGGGHSAGGRRRRREAAGRLRRVGFSAWSS